MPVKWNLLIVLAGVFSATLVVELRAQDYDVLFRKCYSNGMPDQVIISCSAVIARGLADKEDLATAYKNRGNAYDDKGEYDRALEDYEQAVAINPRDADAFNSRGATYMALGRYERAIQDFDQAIALNPASPMAFSNRCFAKALLGQLEQGLADCNEALRVRPKNPGAFAGRGLINLKLKRYDAAIADYNAELQVTPGDPYSLFGRGMAKYMKGDLRGGDGDVVAAQSIKPDIADHMAKLGIRLRDLR
jgi:tetratricopeptide (TPR) repeat protein